MHVWTEWCDSIQWEEHLSQQISMKLPKDKTLFKTNYHKFFVYHILSVLIRYYYIIIKDVFILKIKLNSWSVFIYCAQFSDSGQIWFLAGPLLKSLWGEWGWQDQFEKLLSPGRLRRQGEVWALAVGWLGGGGFDWQAAKQYKNNIQLLWKKNKTDIFLCNTAHQLW